MTVDVNIPVQFGFCIKVSIIGWQEMPASGQTSS